MCLGSYAFYNCPKIKNIIFPNIHRINDFTFYGCSSLESIIIPNLNNVGSYAFCNCSSLSSFPNIENCVEVESHAFYGTKLSGNITIRGGSMIGEYSFFNLSITSIIIKEDSTMIDAFAFAYNELLRIVSLPGCTVNKEAFKRCLSIETLNMSNSDIKMVSGSFAYIHLCIFYSGSEDCSDEVTISVIQRIQKSIFVDSSYPFSTFCNIRVKFGLDHVCKQFIENKCKVHTCVENPSHINIYIIVVPITILK